MLELTTPELAHRCPNVGSLSFCDCASMVAEGFAFCVVFMCCVLSPSPMSLLEITSPSLDSPYHSASTLGGACGGGCVGWCVIRVERGGWERE